MSYPPPAGYGSYGPAGYPPPHDARSSPYAQPSDRYTAPGHPPPSYPPPASGAADPYGYYGQSGQPPPGYGHYPPPGGDHPPPPGGYPPPPGAGYPPPGYPGAAPYGYGAPPPGYPPYGYGAPGYGAPPPPGYGPQPGGYPPHGTLDRGSPRRDRDRDGRRGGNREDRQRNDRNDKGGKGGGKKDRRDGGGDRRDEGRDRPSGNNASEPKTRVQQWLQIHPGWSAIWLEGIDPPKRQATSPNVSMLMLANAKKKDGGGTDFGFVLSHTPSMAKKKDRERECTKDMVSFMDQLPFEEMKAWCQLPDPSKAKSQVQPEDLQRVKDIVQKRCPKAAVDMPEPLGVVLVTAMPWGTQDGRQGYGDAELDVLDRFDAGFGDLWREARRVSGLVHKQWFLSIVWAKQEGSNGLRPFCLGVGFATDRDVSKARAVHSAEMRAHILTEGMFVKASAMDN